MLYKMLKGWTWGRSLPVWNFVEYPPPNPRVKQQTIVNDISTWWTEGGILFLQGSPGEIGEQGRPGIRVSQNSN